jgi:hypothetical protein
MRRTMPAAMALAAATALVALAACSADEQDYQREAEKFIEDEDGDVAGSLGLTFTNAVCEQPASSDVGTTYSCTADGSDGTSYQFTVTIDKKNSLKITDYEPAG